MKKEFEIAIWNCQPDAVNIVTAHIDEWCAAMEKRDSEDRISFWDWFDPDGSIWFRVTNKSKPKRIFSRRP